MLLGSLVSFNKGNYFHFLIICRTFYWDWKKKVTKLTTIQAAWLSVRALRTGVGSVETTVLENIVYMLCRTAGREAYQMDTDLR